MKSRPPSAPAEPRSARGRSKLQAVPRKTEPSRGALAPNAVDASALATRLVAWFDKSRRELPWRQTRDPYSVWVSEVMLQQTRVATVIDYYTRFLRAYPTVQNLAEAPLDQVLTAWSGLGYYRRARALHEGAREVVARHGGQLPRRADLLRAIPGIGRYTAGAIASIAFDEREPLVDGNVARVFARLFALEGDPRAPESARALWDLAEQLVPAKRPGTFNEALMELGATVCTPDTPRCEACPIVGACVARRLGLERSLPPPRAKREPPTAHLLALVAEHREGVLLGHREASGLFGGMWEPPMFPLTADPEAVARELFGAKAVRVHVLGEASHVLTHRKLRVTIARVEGPVGRPGPHRPYVRFAWHDRDGLEQVALAALARKVLSAAGWPTARARV